MNRTATSLLSPRSRATLLITVPIVATAIGLLGTAAVPPDLIHGSARIGPKALAYLKPVTLDYRPEVAWGPGRKSILLTAFPLAHCRVHVLGTTSTAPGRIEVHAIESGGACRGPARTTEKFTLPLPTLLDEHGGVGVQIGPASLHLPRTPLAAKHPKGALNLK